MLKLKLFSNYYIFLDSWLIMCHLQQKYSIFYKSLIENVSVMGEDKRGKLHVS